MNLAELRTRTFLHLRQSSGTTNFTTAQVKDAINQAKRRIEDAEAWPFKEHTWTFATVADQADYYFPSYVRELAKMSQRTSPSEIEILSKMDFDSQFPDPTDAGTGTPLLAYIWGMDNTRIPTSGTDTAANGTTTTAVKATDSGGALSTTDDTYNDWLLINGTRTASRRITDYTGSTKVFTLESAITSQVATDVYFIARRLNKFTLWPTPDAAITIYCAGTRWLPDLEQEYDIPDWGPDGDGFHDLIALQAATILAVKDETIARLERETAKAFPNMKKALFKKTRDRIPVMGSMDGTYMGPSLLPGNYPPTR